VSLIVYRLRAARYGSKILLKVANTGVIIGLILGVIGAAGVIGAGLRSIGKAISVHFRVQLPHPPAMVAEGWSLVPYAAGATTIVVVLWYVIRYLGNLPRIMRTAASASDGAREIRKWMAEGMLNADAYVQLRRLYDEPLKDANDRLASENWKEGFKFVQMSDPLHGSHDYAAIALSLTEPTTLENLVEDIYANTPEQHQQWSQTAESRQALMRTWRGEGSPEVKRIARDDEEGENYHLQEICAKNELGSVRLSLHVGVAKYGEIIRTCDALIQEFALFAYITRSMRLRMRSRTFLHCLPWRLRTHEQEDHPGDIFLRPRARAAGLGIAVATIPHGHDVALVWRSEEVGTYPRCWHVIPAGMCNTRDTEELSSEGGQHVVPDWFVRTSMRSEFMEELYRDEELEDYRLVNWQQVVDERWIEREEGVPIILTGLAYDLLNLRPEICGVAMVKKWAGNKKSWILNWEGMKYRPLRQAGSLEPTKIVQSGAAALYLAQRAMAELTNTGA